MTENRLVVYTFPVGIVKHKSLNIWISGRVGYLKLTCSKAMFPVIVSSVLPSSLLESILGLLSTILNIEIAESLALLISVAMELLWETPNAEIVKAKKTCSEISHLLDWNYRNFIEKDLKSDKEIKLN